MRKILDFISYKKELPTQVKFTYIVNLFSVFLVLLFLGFYISYVKSRQVNLVTLICLSMLLLTFFLLKIKKYMLARLVMISGFLMQEIALVFFWFPKETNFNFFFFIVAPITFFVFNSQYIKDRLIIIAINILAISLLILSELIQVRAIIEISPFMVRLFGVMSAVSTIVSIFIVYFFYAETLGQSQRDLQHLANTDELTNTFNRRSLFREGKYLYKLARKFSRSFILILIDIDFFKKVNDQFGHPAGDEVLKQVTGLLKSHIRQNDILARYGGEEFAIILSDITLEHSVKIAENLRNRIEKGAFNVSQNESTQLTISIGICELAESYGNFDDVMQKADDALYQAKQAGRNCVRIYREKLE